MEVLSRRFLGVKSPMAQVPAVDGAGSAVDGAGSDSAGFRRGA